MITIASNVNGNKIPHEFFCLSKDEKPVDEINGIKVTNGSMLIEMDTKKVFLFDEENKTWLEQ